MTSKIGRTPPGFRQVPLSQEEQDDDKLLKTLHKNIFQPTQAPVPTPKKVNVKPTPVKSEPSLFDRFVDSVTDVFDSVKGKTIKAVVSFVLDTDADKVTIQGKIPQADIDAFYQHIQQEVPHLRSLIQKMLPSLDKFFKTQSDDENDLIFRCLLHVFANLSKKNGANTVEELVENYTLHLINIIGPLLNDVDEEMANGTPPSEALFTPLAKVLFEELFPKDNIFYKFKDTAVLKMAKIFSDGYTPIANWLNGGGDLGASLNAPLPYQQEIDHFAPLILEKVTDFYIQKDRKFLNDLTKCDDFSLIIEKLAPTICDQVLAKFNLPLDKMGLQGRKDILDKAIEAAALRSLVNLSEELFPTYTATPEDFIQEAVSRFSKNLHQACKHVESQNQDVSVDHFYQASLALSKLFLPQGEWLSEFIERRQERFLKPVAELHYSFYTASYNEELVQSYKDRLANVLKDDPDKDVGALVDQLYNLCHNGTSIPKNFLTDYLAGDGKILKFLSYLQKNDKNPLDDAILISFERGVQQILGQADKDISWFGSKIEHMGTTRIFLWLICLLEKVTKDKKYPPDELLFKAFEMILKVGENELNALIESGEENPFTEGSLSPFVKELIDLFSDESVALKDASDLTLPEKIEQKVIKSIHSGCQSGISKILETITSWTRESGASKDKLEALFQSKNMLRLGNLGQHAVTQSIPYFIDNGSEKFVDDTLMPKLAPLLSKSGEALSDEEYQTIREMVHGFLKEFGGNPCPEKQKLIQFLAVFLETAFIRISGDVFERIAAGDSLLEDILLLGIDEATHHFRAIGATKKNVKKDKPLRDELKAEFDARGILHPALQGDDQKEIFFDELADKVFAIFGIDENSEFPIPDWTKGFSFEIQEKWLPIILNKVTDFLCEEGTINQILLSVLNHVKDDNANETSLLQKLFPDNQTHKMTMDDLDPKFNDAYQTELEQKLAEAIEALIKMHPDRIPKLLMRSDKIKSYAAQAVGQPLRGQIRDPETKTPISLLTLIDEVVGSYLDKIAPGQIDETTGEFVYYQTTLEGEVEKDHSDEPIEADAPNLSRFFPKTKKQKRKAKAFFDKEKKDAAKNVPKLLKHIINHQTDQIAIKAFIKSWAKFEKKLMDKMDAWFGDRYGKTVSRFLLPVIRLLIKYPIAFGVVVFNYTVWLVVSQIVKLVINNQATKRAQDVGVKIHDNAVLRMTEQVIDKYATAFS